MDMEMSDEEEEDGQISKFDEEEKERSPDKSKFDDGPLTVDDLMKARLTRDTLARHWRKPWFEELIKGLLHDSRVISLVLTHEPGGWVRYCCAYDKERETSIYRLCEVIRRSMHDRRGDHAHPWRRTCPENCQGVHLQRAYSRSGDFVKVRGPREGLGDGQSLQRSLH